MASGAHPLDITALMPFARTCGIRLESASAEEVVVLMDWDPERCTTADITHGGAIVTLADTAGAACAFLNLPPGAGTSTIESKTNFFRAHRSGTARAVCRPLHAGRTTVVVQTDVLDDQGRRLAQVTQTQAVLAAPGAGNTEASS